MTRLTDVNPTLQDAAPTIIAQGCSRCGAPVESLDRFCMACGAERPLETPRGAAAEPPRYFRCESCGAQVAVDVNQRSYVCPFCDSTYVVEFTPEQTGRQPPEFVIPFAVTPDQALERFRRWLSAGGWFRPGDLGRAQIADRLRGVYLPFWSFSMLAESQWSASIGEHWYRTETYTVQENGKTVTRTRQVQETEWWPLEGRHHWYYSGYLVSGSRGLAQADAEQLKPFHLAALRRYQPQFLAGWFCEEYSVQRQEALCSCQNEFLAREQSAVASFLPGDIHSNLQVRVQFSQVNSDLILLPVYLLSYRYRDKVYRFLVNGQTGKVAGNKPFSSWKIGIAAAIGVILAIVLILLLGR